MEFNVDAFKIYDKKWALVTAGTPEKFNSMTISWGGLGTLWGKAVATVYIRPTRYTYEFMEQNEYFSLSFFPEENRAALRVMGTKSGRDVDKVALSGLTPVNSENGTVAYKEAEVVLICRKMYAQDMDPNAMPAEVRERFYNGEAAHRMYIAEVVGMIEK